MTVLNVVVYIIALLSYLGLILFVVFGSIRAYRNWKKESEVRWHFLFEYLTNHGVKLDSLIENTATKKKHDK